MPLPNPIYIDQFARHRASQVRLLAYQAMEGMEGVLLPDHLSVQPLPTPGAGITCLPGAYAINAKHSGGSFESYLGKISNQDDIGDNSDGIVPVSPTTSSGSRTDLVVARIENPYTVGDGNWPQPADQQEGPYAHIRVIEGVSQEYINNVAAHNNTWSAITLARINRPASTGVVELSHITDLRSLANPGGERIIIIENPPVTPPPIAQQFWTESTPIEDGSQLLGSDTDYKDFPGLAQWQVPVPVWAQGMDLNILLNPRYDGDVYGEFRLVVNGFPVGSVPTQYDLNYHGGPGPERAIMMIGGTESLSSAERGKVVTMKLQARARINEGGKLYCDRGTRVNIWINFKRYPVYSDGGS